MPENRPIATPLENEPPAERSEGNAPDPPKDTAAGGSPQPLRAWSLVVRAGIPALILIAAAVPRFWQIGRESYWYDEVVTVEVARSSGVIAALKRMDASRAPLHPVILHAWIGLLGEGEGTTRTLSALCGLGTVALVFRIGKQIGGWGAGCWAMAFAAASPLLIQYSRETRMYSLLTMLTCLAWWNLLKFRESASVGRCALQAGLMAAIAYAHPLGLLMIAGLGAGWLADFTRTKLRPARWLMIHLIVAVAIAPWIGNYLDHPPEFTSESRELRFLLGMPIGFTGGDSRSLILFLVLVALALFPGRIRGLAGRPGLRALPIACWLIVPPLLLFLYSLFRDSLFGPARYNVYAAPAYCILIGCGLGGLRVIVALVIGGLMGVIVCGPAMLDVVEARKKADWRGAAAWLAANAPGVSVIVVAPEFIKNYEVITARYYLGDRAQKVVPEALAGEGEPRLWPQGRRIYSASLRDGAPLGYIPPVFRQRGGGTFEARERGKRWTVRYHDFSDTLRLIDVVVEPMPGRTIGEPWRHHL